MQLPAGKKCEVACRGDLWLLCAFDIVVSGVEEDVEGVLLDAVENKHEAERTEMHHVSVFKTILPSWTTRMKVRCNGTGVRATRRQGKKRSATWTW